MVGRWSLVGVFLAMGACGADEPSFRLEMTIGVDESWGEGVHYDVNGNAANYLWGDTYTGIDEACRTLDSAPLRVDCWTRDQVSCGVAEIDGACCWARSILDSPIVLGRIAVDFGADGTAVVRDLRCEAEDGTSTHGDDFSTPDAGT